MKEATIKLCWFLYPIFSLQLLLLLPNTIEAQCEILPQCPDICLGATELIVNAAGCNECVCKDVAPPICPKIKCDNCQNGVKSYVDENKCYACKCIDEVPTTKCPPPPFVCPSGCPLKQRITYYDNNNCELCDCNIKCPPVSCNCPANNIPIYTEQENGCLGCGGCKSNCPAHITCPYDCPYGITKEKNAKGCVVCTCTQPISFSCGQLCVFCDSNRYDGQRCKECNCKGNDDDDDDNDDDDDDYEIHKKKKPGKKGGKKKGRQERKWKYSKRQPKRGDRNDKRRPKHGGKKHQG